MDSNSDDAAIAEFHADAKRRRRRIMAVTAILCAVIGVAILVVAFTADGAGTRSGGRFEVRTIAVGIAFLVAAFGSAGMAIKGD